MSARRAIAAVVAALAQGCGASTNAVDLSGERPDAGAADGGAPGAACVAPVGRVVAADGHRCLAVRVGAARVLTTESCLRDATGTAHLPPDALRFRGADGSPEVPVARVTHLRDVGDARPGANLAVVVLTRDDGDAPTAALRPGGPLPPRLEMLRWTEAGLTRSAPCGVTQDLGSTLTHDCPRDLGADVGALVECEGARATLYALDPGGGAPAVSVRDVDGIPLRPRSVAVGPDGAATRFYAFDDGTRRLHVREPAGAGWAPWRALPDVRAPRGERAGALTAFAYFGGEASLAFHESGALVQYRWTLADDPSGFTAWFPYRPAEGADDFVDIASSGVAGDRTHVYALTAGGEVLTQYKRELTSSSDWSPWCSLGSVPGGARIAATGFSAGGRVYQLFVATGREVFTRWAQGPTSGCEAWFPAVVRGCRCATTRPRVCAR